MTTATETKKHNFNNHLRDFYGDGNYAITESNNILTAITSRSLRTREHDDSFKHALSQDNIEIIEFSSRRIIVR